MKKAVILAGGFGTRLSEVTSEIPKPMVMIGGKPIIWHIMKFLSCYKIKEFIICCGYKKEIIFDYFNNYFLHNCNLTINLSNNFKSYSKNSKIEDWKVHLIDTGLGTQTGGRIKKIQNLIDRDENFILTYGDSLSNVNIKKLFNFHKRQKKYATVTAVYPPPRYGSIKLNGKKILSFSEKKKASEGFINGGYFILNSNIFKLIKNNHTIWEQEPIKKLVKLKQLSAYLHNGFWLPMDNLKEYKNLNELWLKNKAPWKIW